jgi:hypothetical protein
MKGKMKMEANKKCRSMGCAYCVDFVAKVGI